jgi:branched-chain amino acid transport system substrate-binding protein
MRCRFAAPAVTVAVAILALSGCGSSHSSTGESSAATGSSASGTSGAAATATSSSAAAKGTPFRVLFVGGLSGPLGVYGQDFVKGLKAGALVLNRQGGIDGHPIELTADDTQGNPSQGITILTNAVQGANKPNLVIPGFVAPEILPYTALLSKAHVLEAIGTAIVSLNNPDKYPDVFLYSPPYADQETAIAAFTKKHGWKSVAILYNDDISGIENKNLMVSAAKAAGVKVVTTVPFEDASLDLTPVFEKAAAAKPQAIWETDQGQSPTIFKARDTSGVYLPLVCDEACGGAQLVGLVKSPSVLKDAWGLNVPISLTPPAKRTAAQREFVTALHQVGGARQLFIAAQEYDELQSVAAAARQANSIDSDAIAKALENLPGPATWALGFRIHFTSSSHFDVQPGDPDPTPLFPLTEPLVRP